MTKIIDLVLGTPTGSYALDKRLDILSDVMDERLRQDKLKAEGRFTHTCADAISNPSRLAVLVEEVGEVARSVVENEGLANDRHHKELRKELIQVMAVCLAWVEGWDPEGAER